MSDDEVGQFFRLEALAVQVQLVGFVRVGLEGGRKVEKPGAVVEPEVVLIVGANKSSCRQGITHSNNSSNNSKWAISNLVYYGTRQLLKQIIVVEAVYTQRIRTSKNKFCW